MLRKKLVSAILLASGASVNAAWAEDSQQTQTTQLQKISVESQLNPPLEPVDISTSTTLQPSKAEMERNGTASSVRRWTACRA